MEPRIAPSILAADFYELRPHIESVKAAGASVLHVDVMDGMFVPNISVGVPVVKNLAQRCGMTLDVHLMVHDPERYTETFANAGADWITVHLEAVRENELERLLKSIRAIGRKAGLSIKPDTGVESLRKYAKLCDVILLMTVPPGFGGQHYGADSNTRIAQARAIIDELNPGCVLSVDGGIDTSTIGGAYRAGARLFVAGSAVFGKPDAGAEVIRLLEHCKF